MYPNADFDENDKSKDSDINRENDLGDNQDLINDNIIDEEEELEDQSGHSESSEGIVDHNPFTSAIIKKVKTNLGPALLKTITDAAHNKKTIEQKNNKEILYSDKSESSVDDLMGDTPSNYNALNGRLDGISAGLKSLVNKGGNLGTPQAPQSLNMKFKSTMSEQEERKFVSNLRSVGKNGSSTIDRSVEGEWGNFSKPLDSNKVQVIGEEMSADEGTSGGGEKKTKKKAIKTNKQFAESSRNQT